MPGMQSSTRGFTLIELLVTIAIIGILAALLLPVIGMVRMSAATVSCALHQREVGIGMLGVNQDSGRLPVPGTLPNTSYPWGWQTTTWDIAIVRFMGIPDNARVLYLWCPQDAQAPWSSSNLLGTDIQGRRTYSLPTAPSWDSTPSYNVVNFAAVKREMPFWWSWEDRISGSQKLGQIQDPSQTILLVENPYAGNEFAHPWGMAAEGTGSIRSWHKGQTNFLFADGHVATMAVSQADPSKPKDHRGNLWEDVRGMFTSVAGD